jgi:hypothetical protein
MWKPVGVVCLWLALIALPHLGSSAVHVSPSGVQIAATVPLEDPGDPFLEAPDTQRKIEIPSSFATLHFKNALDKTLVLLDATLVLDGEPLAPVTDLRPQGDNVVFTGYVAPGTHTIVTHVTCVGKKRGGVFTYMQGYKWEVSSEHTLNVPPKRSMVFTVSARRRKGMNIPVEKQVEVAVYNELLPEPVSEAPETDTPPSVE